MCVKNLAWTLRLPCRKLIFENLINFLGWEEDDNENVGVDVMLEAIAAQRDKKERWEVRPEQILEADKKWRLVTYVNFATR